MAWTTPRTWVAGEVVTAAEMNAHVRDNLNVLAPWSAAWTAWTPAWTGTTTNPVIGNGTITGNYIQVGKTVHFWAKVVAGSTTTYGTGTYQLTLPVAWNASGLLPPLVQLRYKSPAAAYFTGVPFSVASGVIVNIGVQNGATFGAASPTVPFTFASGAEIHMSGTYEAA